MGAKLERCEALEFFRDGGDEFERVRSLRTPVEPFPMTRGGRGIVAMRAV